MMKVKYVLSVLSLIFLLVNCTGKNQQPKLESLWETNDADTKVASSEKFILPDFSREKEIDKDSLEIHYRISPSAQSVENFKVIDSALYMVTYNLSMVHYPENYDKKVDDVHMLQIGDSVSKAYSYYLLYVDSIDTQMRISGEGRSMAKYNYLPEDIYKNFPEEKITVSYRPSFEGPILKYEEPLPEFEWQMSKQTKQILTYSCKKATTTFRGRSYEAWFAPEIPLQEGPWKFKGLPGLILEIYDTQKQYFFTCSGFYELATPQPIKYWEWDYKNTTRKNLDQFLRQAYSNPQAYIQMYNKKLLEFDFFANIRNMIFPYNPIELE